MNPKQSLLMLSVLCFVSLFISCNPPTTPRQEVHIVFPDFARGFAGDSADNSMCSGNWAFTVYCSRDSVKYSVTSNERTSLDCATNVILLNEPLCLAPDSIRWFSVKDSTEQHHGTWIPHDSLEFIAIDTLHGTFWHSPSESSLPNFRSGDTVVIDASAAANSVYSCRRLLEVESLDLQDSASLFIRNLESRASLIQLCQSDTLTPLHQDSLPIGAHTSRDSTGFTPIKMRAWIMENTLSRESLSVLLHPLKPLRPLSWWEGTRTAGEMYSPFCQEFAPDSSGILPAANSSRERWCWPEASTLPESTMIRMMQELQVNCLWQHRDRGIRDSTGVYQRICIDDSKLDYSWMPVMDCAENSTECPNLLPVYTMPYSP